MDLIQSDFQLFGQQHGHRCVRALSHFDLVHDQRDPAVPADADERVRREDRRRCLGGRGKNPRTRGAMPSHQKPTARGGTDEEQLATR